MNCVWGLIYCDLFMFRILALGLGLFYGFDLRLAVWVSDFSKSSKCESGVLDKGFRGLD